MSAAAVCWLYVERQKRSLINDMRSKLLAKVTLLTVMLMAADGGFSKHRQ